MTHDEAVAEYDNFCIGVARSYAESEILQMSQRYGQFYFNLLHEVRPDIANKIRATSLDPFFSDSVSLETEQAVIEYWKSLIKTVE